MRFAHFLDLPIRPAFTKGQGAEMLRLSASGLGCMRGFRSVFSDLNFEVSSGETLALVGPNGAGKSSLLRLLAGLLHPAQGAVTLQGGTQERTVPEQAHYLGHLDALKAPLTVRENIEFWIHYLAGNDLADHGDAGSALAAVGLDSLEHLPAAYLSAGQRRRLSLARLVAVRRPIWLLDEPTSALDAAAQERLAELMRAHLSGGGMIVAATHGPLGVECKTLQLGRSMEVVHETSQLGRSAPSPHSPSKTGVDALMPGEGWGGGSEFGASPAQQGRTPTPNPSPQGGGEPSRVRGDQ
jgi:heme exporter protein A